jgi:8-oxo-dGTP pyrophosphatase MutT (NUDIX family)
MSRKPTPSVQYAALPYRRRAGGGIEVLLITSRETRRWVIPKGWPMPGLTPHDSAKNEAVEESGVVGRIGERSIGFYHYTKLVAGEGIPCRVEVFPLEVETQLVSWLEEGQRNVQWFEPHEAGEAVQEPELSAIIRDLAALLAKI